MDPKKDVNFEQSISRGQSETIQMESDIENPRTDENCDDAMDGETVSIYHDESMKNRIHKPQKAVILRIWAYLKHAWVGVMRGSSGSKYYALITSIISVLIWMNRIIDWKTIIW